ncbi:MAG: OmpA family protein [Gammaproteobacteria bacterium]|nr:OmpA family protein [Gammaproteobacteria bacterium]
MGGGVYQYQLEVQHENGSRSTGERRLFGVNRKSTIQLELAGGAFVSGSHELTPEAKTLLRDTAHTIRSKPNEQVVIAGHTDSIGSDTSNQKLSERRARSALKFLVEVEKLERDRFLVYGYGESRPRASNATDRGRELNRRVEIRGELADVQRALVAKRKRMDPEVLIGGKATPVAKDGRFGTVIEDPTVNRIDVSITTADARSVQTSVAIPTLEITSPIGQTRVPDGDITEHYLKGRTEPGNHVEMDGTVLQVASDGSFSGKLQVATGENTVGVLARNADGVARIVNVRALVTDHDSNGRVMYIEPIPELVLQLPPADTELHNAQLLIPGLTKPGNLLVVNDTAVEVDDEGYFAATVQLQEGSNPIVAVVTDPEGYVGRIERSVEYRANSMFLLAFADARIASIRTTGNLRAAGADETNEVRVDGRVSYYLKGWIKGKYLVTSAFDSGQHEAGGVFADLDDTDSRRLLTNIDPDQHYPVYGDSSTVVYDTERTGKFYLAVESDLLDVRLGSYALNLDDTELSAYRRTLDGARVRWKSDDTDAPRTEATVFTSSVRQQAVHDVIATTGGMLYYLSQDDVIEGSEQVTLIVRDQNTGIVLQRIPQVRNSDYDVKYPEGRLLFRRPLSSMDSNTTIIGQGLLAGNPMSLEVDYETRSSGVKQAIRGGRVQRRVGDSLTVGGSYVEDQQLSSEYSLAGVDVELRLNEHARIVAELANSSGNDSINFVSTDGGLTYNNIATTGSTRGRALKLATELDIGAIRGKAPDEMQLGAYFKRLDDGFRSSGNGAENDSEKMGLHFAWRMTERSSLLARHDRQRAIAGDNANAQTTIQWNRNSDRLKLTLELQDRETRSTSSQSQDTAVAAQAKMDWTGRLSTSIEYQEALRGQENQLTTVGLDYQVGEAVTLLGRASVGTRGHASEVGARVNLDGKQVYVTQRRSGNAGSSEDATVLGAEATYGENGRIYTEYQWAKMTGHARSQSLVGMRRRWYFGEGFNLLLAGEHTQLDMTTDDTGRYTLALGLSYDNDGAFRARSLNEWRRDRGTAARSQFITDTFAELSLNDSFTLQGKFRRSWTTASVSDPRASFHEESIGLAYRPINNDRFNALARITLLSEEPLQRGIGQSPYSSRVFSTDWSYDVTSWLEWVGKEAFRIKEAEGIGLDSFTTRTHLSIQRMNINLLREFALGMEYRRLAQDETASVRTGWLTELMWDHFQYVRLGLGFNFTDFSDDEFSDHEYSEQGWFLRMQGKY